MSKKAPSSKVKIAQLFSQLSYFTPERDADNKWTGGFLVNQKKLGGRKAPERDELLHMIGEASTEITRFIDEHEKLKEQLAAMTAGMMQMSSKVSAMLGNPDQSDDLLAKFDVVTGRYDQMVALLNNLLNNIPTEKMKAVIQNFLEFKRGQLTLVNQNEEASQVDAESGEPVCTCDQNKFPCPVHRNAW